MTDFLDLDNDRLIEIYLDYVNNFATLDKFAEHYNLDEIDAHYLIEVGRKLNYEDATKTKLSNELISLGYDSEIVTEFIDEHFQNLLEYSENKNNFLLWHN